MTGALWDFADINTDRREALLIPFDFSSLIDTIRSKAQNIRWERARGQHEAKGSWRPVFSFDVCQETFDRFFNSPYGYRGQYLADPEQGRRSNFALLSALIDKLVASLCTEPELSNQIRRSLGSEHAKIWIDEDQHKPRTPELIVEVRVPEWEAAAEGAHARLAGGDSTITSKEVDRIYGVRAPLGTTLKAFGAWVASDGGLWLVHSKTRRAEEIKAYGVS